MVGQARNNNFNKYKHAVKIMEREKNLSALNMARLCGIGYQTAKSYLNEMVENGLVEVYREQYRSNVIARIYQWIEVS